MTNKTPQNNIESIVEKLMNEFKCIQSGCDNNGTYPTMGSNGDCEPTQCQFCDQVRFPLKEKIK